MSAGRNLCQRKFLRRPATSRRSDAVSQPCWELSRQTPPPRWLPAPAPELAQPSRQVSKLKAILLRHLSRNRLPPGLPSLAVCSTEKQLVSRNQIIRLLPDRHTLPVRLPSR